MAAKAAKENAVPMAILASQLQVTADTFHSMTPEVKEISSATAVRPVM